MSIYKKLQDARVKLQKAPLQKSGNNKFAGYSYFELGDFLPTVQEIFNDIGLCGVVSFGQDIATLVIHDVDSDGTVTFTSPMSEASLKGCHPIQNLGAVQSYIRRYLWTTALEIVENDVLDATTGKEEPAKKKAETVVTTNVAPPVWAAQPVAQQAPVNQQVAPQTSSVAAATDVPKTVTGTGKDWSLTITVDPSTDKQAWIDAVNEVLLSTLVFAETEDDLKAIFKVNKVLFETYKSFDEAQYKELTDAFAARKAKINAPKAGA